MVAGEREAGYQDVQVHASGTASRVYLYNLQAGDFVQTRQLVLLRCPEPDMSTLRSGPSPSQNPGGWSKRCRWITGDPTGSSSQFLAQEWTTLQTIKRPRRSGFSRHVVVRSTFTLLNVVDWEGQMLDFKGGMGYVRTKALMGHWRGSPRQTWKRTCH